VRARPLASVDALDTTRRHITNHDGRHTTNHDGRHHTTIDNHDSARSHAAGSDPHDPNPRADRLPHRR
jgi:hypothetical protein